MSPELPRDWSHVALGDLIASLDAGVSVNSDGRPCGFGEIGVLKTSCVGGGRFNPAEHKAVIASERGRVRVPVTRDSIILSRMNTPALVGENAYVEADHPELFLPDRLWLLKTSDRADCRWLSCFMQSQFFRRQLNDIATGTSGSMKNISKARLADLSLNLPPLEEQRRIAEVLRSADEAISATQALIQQAEALWQGITERLIWDHGIQCPECVLPLGRALLASDYGVNVPLTIEANGHPVLRMGNIQDGRIVLSDLKWGEVPVRDAEALALSEGDILFNRTNSRDLVGKVALVREPMDCLYASYIVRLSVDRSVADPYYLFAVMHSARGQRAFKTIATPGVSQSNINPTNLKKQPIPLPDLTAQRMIAGQLRSIEDARLVSQQQLEALQVIKIDLTANLLSGRVRVPA